MSILLAAGTAAIVAAAAIVIGDFVYKRYIKPVPNTATIAKLQGEIDTVVERNTHGIAEAVDAEMKSIEATLSHAYARVTGLLGTNAVHPTIAAALSTTADHVVNALNTTTGPVDASIVAAIPVSA